MYALSAGDGYIFSKSVKMLPAIEKEWVLLDNDYREVHDSNGHLLIVSKSVSMNSLTMFPHRTVRNER